MYLNVKYRSMYTLDILGKTLSFTLPTSSQVTLRLGVDVFYTGSGTSFNIPLPLKNGQVQEGAYVLNINGTETILSYKFPTEVPDVVWDVNGLLSTLSVSDNKAYTGTIISQSIECMPPAPLVAKTGLNKINYTPNIYSGDWSVIREIKLSYDAGNGLNVINTIENTYTEIVLNINAKNLYQAVTNYIKSFVENCSPQREIAKFTKVNAYLQQYENYIELVDYENAYNSLVKAGELVGVDKTIQEIIPFTINENGGGCCDKEVVPAHTAYFGFSDVALMTDSVAKTLSIEKYNIYAHREWHMSQDGITSRFAYIVVPTSVAALIAMVKIKGGLLAVWESQLITIDGVPYTAIKSPNKFFDKDATFVTDALDDCDIALQWVNSNGSNVLTHIADGNLHLKQGDRTKLDNLDQTLSGFEPKRGDNDNYVTDEEKAKLDRLLVDFTVPSSTPSLSFDRDKNGVLFSDLSLRSIRVEAYLITDITVAAGSERLSINNDNSNTYSAVSSAVAGGYRLGIYKLTEFTLEISIVNNNAILNGIGYGSQTTIITNTNVLSYIPIAGIKSGAQSINSIKLEKYNNNFNFLVGSSIKIYRND